MNQNDESGIKNKERKIVMLVIIALVLFVIVIRKIIILFANVPAMEDIYFQMYDDMAESRETKIYKYDAQTQKVNEIGSVSGYFHNCVIDEQKKYITGVRSPFFSGDEISNAGIVRYSLEDGTSELLRSENQMSIGKDKCIIWERSFPFNQKEGSIPRCLQRDKLMTNEVSLGLIPRSLLRGVSLTETRCVCVMMALITFYMTWKQQKRKK